MADPLSIAASIAGVISLADIVFVRTRKYLSSAKNADKDVKDLSQEVLLLSGALHSLSKLAQALDTDGLKDQNLEQLRMHHIAACHATLDQVRKKLEKFEHNGTRRKLVWPFVSDRTKELLAEISRHKENIDLALTADSMGTLLRVLSETEEAHKDMEKLLEEAKKTREIITRIHQDSGRKAVLDYFLRYNPQQNYEMSLSLRHPRTGLWLIRRPEFQTWLGSPDSALWLSGIPGAGKTVLAGTIIEEALKMSSENVAIVFFFCDYKNAQTQTPENVLSALASQLASQKEEAYGYLDRYYRELHPFRGLERGPDVSGLQRVLGDMVKLFDHVYSIVDGLDECSDNTDNVIDGLLGIIHCSDNISTAFLSRDEYNIRDRLEDDFTAVEITAHTEDITEYVTSEIEQRISNKRLRIDDLSLKGEILKRLIDGAKGMFRWVACQLDFLGDCLSDKECRDALGQLPPGLNESYMRILQRVPKGKERIVQMMLNFIAYADPKLGIPMLREALSVPEKLDKNTTLGSQSIMREGSITRLCRSLIRKSNDGCHYEFAHFSVQEFLEREMQNIPELEHFRVSKSTCQLLLAKQCLRYLLLQNFSSLPVGERELQEHIDMRIRYYPFYSYAAVFWPVFAKDHWVDDSLIELAGVLFRPEKSGNFISWALELTTFVACCSEGMFSLDTFRHPLCGDVHIQNTRRLFPQLVDKKFTTLHMAAALALSVICSGLADNVNGVNMRSGFGSTLQCAVQGLYLASKTEQGYLPAIYSHSQYYNWCRETDSAEFGRENTIRVLLRSGADHAIVCSSPFAGQTLVTVALKIGSQMKDLTAVTVLLAAGYQVGEDDLSGLSWFREELIDRGTFEDDSDDTYGLESLITCLNTKIDRSPSHFGLCQAAWSLAVEMRCGFTTDPSIVDTRISHSEDALAKTIFTSVRDADIETLAEVLKDPRADIAILTGDEYGTIFDQWLGHAFDTDFSERLAVLEMLLSAGMEVNRPDHEGLMPLHRLAILMSNSYGDDSCSDNDDDFEKLCDIVNAFIRKGSGCSQLSRANQTVFHLGLGSISFIGAVLETQTKDSILSALRTRDDEGHTPITLALQYGKDNAALLLLERSNCDPETLRGPASIDTLCVAGGTYLAFNFLLDAEVILETCDAEVRNTPLLHHLGPKTGKDFVFQLIHMFPGGLLSRVDGKLPLEAYLERCINCKPPAINLDVLGLLSALGSDEIDQRERKAVWEQFILTIQNMTGTGTMEDNSLSMKMRRKRVATKAATALTRLGFVQPYETVTRSSAVLPLLRLFQGDLEDLPVSGEAIRDILKQTVFWESLRESGILLRLLSAAVRCGEGGLVELLLENGMSVHERIDEMSALEVACLKPATYPDERDIFTLLLEHADASRWDEINPHQNQRRGLIHYLAGGGKEWQLVELIKRGADVNSPTSIHVDGQPAIVQHLWEGSVESAMTLLDMGADPTAADGCGIDVAMQAAFHGHIDILQHLHKSHGKVQQLNWQRTCVATLTGVKGVTLSVSEMNALHLAAWDGQCDALGFYIDNSLLTDLNSVSVELLTPMHLAAFNGHTSAMKFLYSRGAGLNLKSADGSLPLHLAVRNGHADAVKFLVENGSAMDGDIRGLSPVRYAIQMQDKAIIDCLCATKQYLDDQSVPGKHRERDLVPLFGQALIRGDIEECELLHDQGCHLFLGAPKHSSLLQY